MQRVQSTSVVAYTPENRCGGMPAFDYLLSEASIGQSIRFLGDIPADMSTLWGYEIRLADYTLQADFQICISKATFGAFQEYLWNVPYAHRMWGNLRTLVDQWRGRRTDLYYLLKNIWLEMDATQMASTDPVPNFFFGPVDGLNTDAFTKVVPFIFSYFGETLEKPSIDSLAFIHAALPAGSWIPQIGRMTARPGKQPVRLFVHRISELEIVPFLQRIGYRLTYPMLVTLLRDMHEVFDFVDINVETCLGSGPHRVGLEGYIQRWDAIRLQKVLDFLQKRKLIEWVYTDRLRQFLAAATHRTSAYQEYIHHIKITFASDGPLEAKLYIGVKNISIWSKVEK
ncbi:hypothetical protein CLV98_11652 [Dyadobacter jejuensis]|uniref:Uncharacterized protein n=1 Tax=Dyadobacter jejuensis TaxID=1082580 RepID=A0A316AAG1_9BACT|nr:hypothetical protein [Dyadobacter jejuensis]PWJ54765.1 hypothetical protein CLV98_11652 [Dyadobacter jejuensis]